MQALVLLYKQESTKETRGRGTNNLLTGKHDEEKYIYKEIYINI